MRELTTVAEVVAACGDDDLIVWAAQGMRPGVRAWAAADAVVVASPRASRRDRLALWGDPVHVIPLVRHALAEVGPSFRPFGDRELVEKVVRGAPELTFSGGFSWMATTRLSSTPPGNGPAHDRTAGDGPERGRRGHGPLGGDTVGYDEDARRSGEHNGGAVGHDGDARRSRGHAAEAAITGWLDPDDDPEVTDFLTVAHPDSYAVPGLPGVGRWAGVRDTAGALLAVAADAWSAPTVGLIAGVATAVPARRRGLGERVCRFVAEALLAEHGRAALMVDDENRPALNVYERLGFVRRRVAAAGIAGVA